MVVRQSVNVSVLVHTSVYRMLIWFHVLGLHNANNAMHAELRWYVFTLNMVTCRNRVIAIRYVLTVERFMIGTESFLLELLPLVVPLILIVGGVRIWLKERRFLGLVFTAFASIMIVVMGIRYFHQVSNRQFLANLTVVDIKSIRVGDTIITDPAQIEPITTSLNDCQWFSSNHGGWADTVDLIVTPKHGDVHRFWIGYYLREHGIVIQFYRGDENEYSADGYAFSPTLPESLAKAGVRLPEQP